MTATGHPQEYRSVFLDNDWVHQRYFGWAVAEDLPGLRVLRKKRFVFDRTLALLTADGEMELDGVVQRAAAKPPTADIVIHDFDEVLGAAPVIAGHRFRVADDAERLLNTATVVVELGPDEDQILAGMSADYRRKLRKAKRLGISVDACERPGTDLVEAFHQALSALARERAFAIVDRQLLALMYENGDAVMFVARRNAEITNFLHVFVAGATGIFMHGVNVEVRNDGAGQLLHWEAMRYLRAHGYKWYDLGGVRSNDPTDGMYRFKAGFGGHFKRLGKEWRHSGLAVKGAIASYKVASRAKLMLRPSPQ